ncbi:microtubule-associated protein RP/EB family member 3-like [Tropilaelaps mercedesae]|uniref:Microtubule-associated protein RP/EB family member 3-like n=1 Tax=Tropilaelaps mercedesae TaxID=418985 RepID=A0A1V9WZ51_9ACAR|nr:microtubule-associated protein RP/EB family member 3-like [Tropilaelaps mercedesae]
MNIYRISKYFKQRLNVSEWIRISPLTVLLRDASRTTSSSFNGLRSSLMLTTMGSRTMLSKPVQELLWVVQGAQLHVAVGLPLLQKRHQQHEPQQRELLHEGHRLPRLEPEAQKIDPEVRDSYKEIGYMEAAAPASRSSTGSGIGGGTAGGGVASAKIQALETQVAELTDQVSGLERERDFYYNKLRDIELLCQEYEAKEDKAPALEQILEILYATEEGFSAPEDYPDETAQGNGEEEEY